MTTTFFRMKKLRGATRVLVASRHNKRTTQAEVGASAHIDPLQTPSNFLLHGPPSPEGVAELARTLMTNAGVKILKKNAVTGLELVFSLPASWAEPVEQFFRDCLGWAAENFGGLDNVLSADVHLDEAAPHMHILILPLMSGRMNGSSLFGHRQRLLALQDGFHTAIGARYGLARGAGRLAGLTKEKTAQKVIQRLRGVGDAALSSCLWAELREAIESDPSPFAAALGIQPDAPEPKPMRTMAAIFTSTGKGSRRPEPIGNPKIPIGNGRNPQSLSCVGVPTLLRPKQAPDDERERTVDRSDIDFFGFPDDDQRAPAWD